MSTNKTPNLNLHSWVGTDNVKRQEFNDNFDAIDAFAGRLSNVPNYPRATQQQARDLTDAESLMTPWHTGQSLAFLGLGNVTPRVADDLNNEVLAGRVITNLSTLNRPSGSSWWTVDIQRRTSGNVVQIAYETNGAPIQIYVRSLSGSGWSSWARLIDQIYGDERYVSKEDFVLPSNSKTASVSLMSYPNGVSVMPNSVTTSGFPTQHGMLHTYRTGAYGWQTYIRVSYAEHWVRSWQDTSNSWTSWIRVIDQTYGDGRYARKDTASTQTFTGQLEAPGFLTNQDTVSLPASGSVSIMQQGDSLRTSIISIRFSSTNYDMYRAYLDLRKGPLRNLSLLGEALFNATSGQVTIEYENVDFYTSRIKITNNTATARSVFYSVTRLL